MPREDGGPSALPGRRVTINQLVAWNMAYFRKAAGFTQEELAERLGWSAAVVSAAERSWDAKRVRSFSADDLIEIAEALAVALPALFLPPEDHGTAFRYVITRGADPGNRDFEGLLPLIFGAFQYDSPAFAAYRQRLIATGWRSPLVDDAYRQADEALVMARGRAETIVGDTRARAEALERDAQERYRQAMTDLIVTRGQLERQVDNLRAFEREYRTRLQKFMEDQFRAFWNDTDGIDADQLLAAMREQAGEGGVAGVTAVLLSEDGTYDIIRGDQAAGFAVDETGEAEKTAE